MIIVQQSWWEVMLCKWINEGHIHTRRKQKKKTYEERKNYNTEKNESNNVKCRCQRKDERRVD